MMVEAEGMAFRMESEERLPWLEPVDDTPEPKNMTARLIGLVLAGLVLIGAVVGGLWWWQNNAAGGRGEIIAAVPGPYKVAPKAEPGRFDGEGTIAVAASEGQQTVSSIDASRLPEVPVPPAAQPRARTTGTDATAAVKTATRSTAATDASSPTTATVAAGASGTIQLGAFASERAATRAWDSLKTRFEWLAPVNGNVVPASVDGRTVYRLRAAAGGVDAARSLCNRLRVAGETCIAL